MKTQFRVKYNFTVNGEKYTGIETEASWYLIDQQGNFYSYSPLKPITPCDMSMYKELTPLFKIENSYLSIKEIDELITDLCNKLQLCEEYLTEQIFKIEKGTGGKAKVQRELLKKIIQQPTKLECVKIDYALGDDEKEEPFCVACGQYLDRLWKVCPVCCIEIDWSKESNNED